MTDDTKQDGASAGQSDSKAMLWRKLRFHVETPRSAGWYLLPTISFMGSVPMWGQVFSMHAWWGMWGVGFAVDYLGGGWYSQEP